MGFDFLPYYLCCHLVAGQMTRLNLKVIHTHLKTISLITSCWMSDPYQQTASKFEDSHAIKIRDSQNGIDKACV